MDNKGINNIQNHPPALNSALSAESINCNRKANSLSNASLGNNENKIETNHRDSEIENCVLINQCVFSDDGRRLYMW